MKRILSALLLVAACAVHAEAPAKPDRVVVCAACHGENGASQLPIYPNLAGQQRSYIEQALHAYKSGERRNAIMAPQAAGLSDADIKQLAAWYSQQPAKVYTPNPEGEPAKAAAPPAAGK